MGAGARCLYNVGASLAYQQAPSMRLPHANAQATKVVHGALEDASFIFSVALSALY